MLGSTPALHRQRLGIVRVLGPGGLGEAVDQREEPDRGQQDTRDVVPGVAVRLALLDERDRGRRHDQGHRHVDPEAPAPRGVLREQAADDQADRGTAAGQCSEHAERLGALLRLGERDRHDGQGGGRHQGREGTLEGTRGEQQLLVGRQPTDRRGTGEPDQTDDERALAPGVVGDPPTQQQQCAEGEGVRRHHPLPVGVADAEVLLCRGQGDVHDRRIEDDHQLRGREDDQRPPSARVGLGPADGGFGSTHRFAHDHSSLGRQPPEIAVKSKPRSADRSFPTRGLAGGDLSDEIAEERYRTIR